MLKKTPKPLFWKFVKKSTKIVFIVEALCFAASYGIYYRMNTNRDFRLYINKNFPILLDGYYELGELFGNSHQRQLDSDIWKQLEASEDKIPTPK